MAIKIRLTRVGRKKVPGYRVVVAEARRKRDGRVIERLGHYDPRKTAAAFIVDQERLKYWLSKGAQPTGTVADLIRRLRKATAAQPAA